MAEYNLIMSANQANDKEREYVEKLAQSALTPGAAPVATSTRRTPKVCFNVLITNLLLCANLLGFRF